MSEPTEHAIAERAADAPLRCDLCGHTMAEHDALAHCPTEPTKPTEHAIAERVPCEVSCDYRDEGEECPDPAAHCGSTDDTFSKDRCDGCEGDGTRWVITDVRVEPVTFPVDPLKVRRSWREVES